MNRSFTDFYSFDRSLSSLETVFVARIIHFFKDCPLSVRTVHFSSKEDKVFTRLVNNRFYFPNSKAFLFYNMIFLVHMIHSLFPYQVFCHLRIHCHIGRKHSHWLDHFFYKALYNPLVYHFYSEFEIVLKIQACFMVHEVFGNGNSLLKLC